MVENKKSIFITLPNQEIEFSIFGESSTISVFEVADAIENGEAPLQIVEGNFYEYKITDGFRLEKQEIVTQSKFNSSAGRISPNIYVGTLSLNVLDSSDKNVL